MLTLARPSTIARFAAAIAVAAGLSLGGAVLQPAAAGGGGGCNGTMCGSSTPSTPTTSGHTVTVTVSGSFVGSGSDGSPGGGTTAVSVPSPCWYTQGFSGKEYAHWIDSGEAAAINHHTGGDSPLDIRPGYKSHKNDTDGHYYGGECSSETFGDNLDGFFKYSEKWFKDHGEVWVPGGQEPPTPPVPPEVLLVAAQKALTLPEPVFDYNPKQNGAASLVNLDTWFWLHNDIDTGGVTATAGGNSVTVTATRESVSFTAPTAGSVSCADGGTEWSDGASSDCVLYFRQASAGTPVTSTARWGLSWTANGAPRGNLPAITASQTDDVKVIEVQAVVNRAS